MATTDSELIELRAKAALVDVPQEVLSKMFECQRCGIMYLGRTSKSTVKMQYCGTQCELTDLKFIIKDLPRIISETKEQLDSNRN